MTFFYFIKLVITHVACHTIKWAVPRRHWLSQNWRFAKEDRDWGSLLPFFL